MTVSQCLRKIAPLKNQLKTHREHAESSVLYEEKRKPAYVYASEMEGMEKARHELLRLQTALAVSNATTHIEWKGKKVALAWAVRFLEELKGHKAWLDNLIVSPEARKEEDSYVPRYSGGVATSVNEPRIMICDLPEAKRFELSQKIQEEFDQLNDLVETSNHQTLVFET